MTALQYENITTGIFIDRPNRFIAHVEVNGRTETVHVKNPGILFNIDSQAPNCEEHPDLDGWCDGGRSEYSDASGKSGVRKIERHENCDIGAITDLLLTAPIFRGIITKTQRKGDAACEQHHDSIRHYDSGEHYCRGQ